MVAVFVILAPFFLILSIVFYGNRGKMFGVPTEIVADATLLIETDQGVVCWVVKKGLSMFGGMHQNFQANIISLSNGKNHHKNPLSEIR